MKQLAITSQLIAKRIAHRRKELGMSTKTLGVLAGLDPNTSSVRVKRYEKGVHTPDLQTVNVLASALDISVAYFFAETESLADVIKFLSQLTPQAQVAVLERIKAYGSREKDLNQTRRVPTEI